MGKLVIELDVHEALTALGPIQDRMLEAQKLAAISTGDEHEIALMSARLLGRVSALITDALYPSCDWIEECDMAVAGSFNGRPYCRFHLAQLEARQAASLPA